MAAAVRGVMAVRSLTATISRARTIGPRMSPENLVMIASAKKIDRAVTLKGDRCRVVRHRK
jgi:hypothetical protein